MSDYSPGAFHFADRVVALNVKESHREAESYRLLCKVKGSCERNPRFYFGALAWLGHRLMTWGEYLQDRYSADGTAPVPQSA
jgi:hypothetical protein